MGACAKTVRVSCEMPAACDIIWEKLQKLATLQTIAAPYASFSPQGEDNAEIVWAQGRMVAVDLKVFGFLPMGTHTIRVREFDRNRHTVYTNEGNRHVPVWNHKITLRKIDGNRTLYTDEVEIFAGWKTAFVVMWSKAFYRHRQRRWVKILRESQK